MVSPTAQTPAQRTVLLVEDDRALAELYATALDAHGYRVVTASNGLQALNAVQRFRPALLLLDISIPVVDGWAVLREMSADPRTRDVPVVVVTGTAHSMPSHLSSQTRAFLRKPLAPQTLVEVVERWIDTPSRVS